MLCKNVFGISFFFFFFFRISVFFVFLRISQKTGGFVSFLWKILHFLIFFHVPNTFWWLLNFERYVHIYLSFRCIFLICSCHLNNHPSILWTILYPSPDDGYYNRNVNVDFISRYIHLFGLYFFLLPSYIYIYIYSHPQTDLFRSIRTHQCG